MLWPAKSFIPKVYCTFYILFNSTELFEAEINVASSGCSLLVFFSPGVLIPTPGWKEFLTTGQNGRNSTGEVVFLQKCEDNLKVLRC